MPVNKSLPLIASVILNRIEERHYLYWVNVVSFMENPISFEEYKERTGLTIKKKKARISEETKKVMREDAINILGSISEEDKI